MSTISFAEARGLSVINWREVIEQFITQGQTKPTYEYYELAREWGTCAVGMQSVDISRSQFGTPSDHRLTRYGKLFFFHIHKGRWEKALQTLNKIEQRADVILHPDEHRITFKEVVDWLLECVRWPFEIAVA